MSKNRLQSMAHSRGKAPKPLRPRFRMPAKTKSRPARPRFSSSALTFGSWSKTSSVWLSR